MSDYTTITELADKLGIAPRKISDLFYARRLDRDKCPVVGGRRLIPTSYVRTVVRVLTETGATQESVSA